MSVRNVVAGVGTGALYASVATPLVFWGELYYPSTTARGVFLRLTSGLAAAAAVYVLVSEVWDSRDFRERLGEPAFVLLSAYAAVSLVSAALGEAPWKAVFGGIERMWGGMAWVHMAALYFAARVLLDERRWVSFFRLSLAAGVVVAGYGILDQAGHLPAWAAVWPSAYGGASTVGNPGVAAGFLLLQLPVAGVAWAQSTRWPWRALTAGAGVFVVAALATTGSRSVVLGLVAGGVAAVVAVALWSRSARLRRAAVSVLGLGLLLASLAYAFRTLPFMRDLINQEWYRGGNIRYRLTAWDAAVEGFRANPVLGVGPENYDLVWDRHVDPAEHGLEEELGTWRTERTHNEFLQALATTGLAGALSYAGLWVAVLLSLYRGWRSGRLDGTMAIAFIVGLTAYFVYVAFWFESLHTTFVWIVLAAYLCHRTRGGRWASGDPGGFDPVAVSGEANSSVDGGPRERWAAGAAAGVLLLLLGSGLYHARLLRAAHHVDRADRSRSVSEKLAAGRLALQLRPPGVPKIVTRYSQLLIDLHGRLSEAPQEIRSRASGTVVEAMREVDAELEEEIRASPSDARLRFVRSSLAIVAFNLSEDREDYATAVRAMEAAVENAPTTAVYRRGLAELYRMARRWEAAERVLREGLRVAPGPQTRVALARTLLEAGRPAEGAAQLVELLRAGHRPPGELAKRYRKALREAGAEEELRSLERALEGS